MAEKKHRSKRQLEVLLGKLKILDHHNLELEQYPVYAEAASELLYLAGFEHDDLGGRIIDLGTGTGRLAIGAALMGARETVAVDTDERALALAKENVETAGVIVEWARSDIENFNGRFATVIMNATY